MRRVVGWILVGVAAVAFAVYLLGLLDAAGSQLANDGDPFGTPAPWYVPVLGMLGSVVLGAFGYWLTRRSDRGTA